MPLAKISFEPGAGSVGLSVFQKLREYRRLHELQWGDEIFLDKDGKPEKKIVRGRKIMNQKANSIADIAVVLKMIGRASGVKIGLKGGFSNADAEAYYINAEAKKKAQHLELHNGKTGKELKKIEEATRLKLKKKFDAQNGETDLRQVEVLWKDLTDAEYARFWSKNVTHALLDVDKKSRVEAIPWTEGAVEPVEEAAEEASGTKSLKLDESPAQKSSLNSARIEEQVSQEIEEIETQGLSEAEREADAAARRQEIKSQTEGETLSAKQQLALEKQERDRLEDERLAAHVERQTKSKADYLLTQGLSESKIRQDVEIYRERLLREIAERNEKKISKAAAAATKAPAHPAAKNKSKKPNTTPAPEKNEALAREKAVRKTQHLQSLIENLDKQMPLKEKRQRKFVDEQVQEKARYLAEQGKTEEEQKIGVAERKERLEREYAALRERQLEQDMEKRRLWTAELEALERRGL